MNEVEATSVDNSTTSLAHGTSLDHGTRRFRHGHPTPPSTRLQHPAAADIDDIAFGRGVIVDHVEDLLEAGGVQR